MDIFDEAHDNIYNIHMILVLLALSEIGLILIASEVLWRKRVLRGEYGRKVVHMAAGLSVAFWPFIMSFTAIQIIALAAGLTIVASRKFKIFHAIHDVPRLTYGEILYPLSILILASIAQANWIFTVSVLFIALADGMAAIVGKKWASKKYTFKVGRSKKSALGTTAYILFAYVSLAVGLLIGGKEVMTESPLIIFALLPLTGAFLEVVSPLGLDNITAPLLVMLVLNKL